MRKTACALMGLVMLGGCVSSPQTGGPNGGHGGFNRHPPTVPHVQGPYGTPVQMAPPYSMSPPNKWRAHAMMSNSVPLNTVQLHGSTPSATSGIAQASAMGSGSGLRQAQFQIPGARPPALMPPRGGMLSPPGIPAAPGLAAPQGPMRPANHRAPSAAVAAVGAIHPGGAAPFATMRTQVRFDRPSNMKVYWYTRTPDGKDSWSEFPIETPGRYNFLQRAKYRLKLNVPGIALPIYPTLEVWPGNSHSAEFLAHAAVPVSFTPDDFKQVTTGNYVVKVVYLPNAQNQNLAFAALGEINSTQLEPGADPIREAQSRGSILLVIRMGNMDQEAPNTPRINAPARGMMPPPPGFNPMMGGLPPRQMTLPPGMKSQMPAGPISRQSLKPGQMPMPPRMPMMPGTMPPPPPGMMPPGMMPPGTNPAMGQGPQGPMSNAAQPGAIRQTSAQAPAPNGARTAGQGTGTTSGSGFSLFPFFRGTSASNSPANCST